TRPSGKPRSRSATKGRTSIRAARRRQNRQKEERMIGFNDVRAAARLVFVFLALILAQPVPAADEAAKQQAEPQVTQPLNNAPFWGEVRKGQNPYQVTQVRGIETNVLVQSRGETWRQLRPWISLAGGCIIALALVGLFGYYVWRGPIALHDKPA